VSANGIQLHIAECGEGPLVLLAHGFPQFWWAWRHQLTGLADAGFHAVAVDLRGYGDSDKPPRGYDLWTLAGDLAGLIRVLGRGDATVVGHGFGGLIGWTLAALHPRLVRSLAVLGTPHPLALRRAAFTQPRRQGLASARHVLGVQLPFLPERALRAEGAARVEWLLRSWSAPGWCHMPEFDEVVRRNREAMLIPGVPHCSLEYYRWAVRSQARPDGRRFAADIARHLDLPVLQIHGAEDPRMLEPTARASARWVVGEHLYEVLPEIGHFVHEEAPQATTDLLTKFLLSH
jgi:pimeloyl-ACP methyl ester carboxylesterase